ncbi:hypothetical protein Bbelb_190040 [Branchiostoma belcheri]|nr:hypothetical protein Bbelb_190040 [Branchiostoma belcheri]
MKVLLIFGSFLAFAQQVTPQTTYNEKTLVDSEVTLPCDYDQATDGNIITVTWTVLMGGSNVNLYIKTTGSTGNRATPPAQYAGRVELVGDVNLKLTGVRIEDDQQYRCAVTASVDSETSSVNLKVFVQPSRPSVQVKYDPEPADLSSVPLSTTVTFTCTSAGGRPPATLNWVVTENGKQVDPGPTYTSSTNSPEEVGDATSTLNLTPKEYNVASRVQCTASGPDPIEDHHSTPVSFTTEPAPTTTEPTLKPTLEPKALLSAFSDN